MKLLKFYGLSVSLKFLLGQYDAMQCEGMTRLMWCLDVTLFSTKEFFNTHKAHKLQILFIFSYCVMLLRPLGEELPNGWLGSNWKTFKGDKDIFLESHIAETNPIQIWNH